MYRANLSWSLLRKTLAFLTNGGLIEKDPRSGRYAITERGISFLRRVADLEGELGFPLQLIEAGEVWERASMAEKLRASLAGADVGLEDANELEGASGVKHKFDFVFRKGGKLIVADLVYSTSEVSEEPIVSLFAKKHDVGAQGAILVSMSRLSELVKKLSASYGVEVIEAKDGKRAAKELIKALER